MFQMEKAFSVASVNHEKSRLTRDGRSQCRNGILRSDPPQAAGPILAAIEHIWLEPKIGNCKIRRKYQQQQLKRTWTGWPPAILDLGQSREF